MSLKYEPASCAVEHDPLSIGEALTSPALSSDLLLSSLELSDTTIYEPQTRALLGIASHFCEVVVLKLRTVPIRYSSQIKNSPSDPSWLKLALSCAVEHDPLSIGESPTSPARVRELPRHSGAIGAPGGNPGANRWFL